jgi:hypothetical protein
MTIHPCYTEKARENGAHAAAKALSILEALFGATEELGEKAVVLSSSAQKLPSVAKATLIQ